MQSLVLVLGRSRRYAVLLSPLFFVGQGAAITSVHPGSGLFGSLSDKDVVISIGEADLHVPPESSSPCDTVCLHARTILSDCGHEHNANHTGCIAGGCPVFDVASWNVCLGGLKVCQQC